MEEQKFNIYIFYNNFSDFFLYIIIFKQLRIYVFMFL